MGGPVKKNTLYWVFFWLVSTVTQKTHFFSKSSLPHFVEIGSSFICRSLRSWGHLRPLFSKFVLRTQIFFLVFYHLPTCIISLINAKNMYLVCMYLCIWWFVFLKIKGCNDCFLITGNAWNIIENIIRKLENIIL